MPIFIAFKTFVQSIFKPSDEKLLKKVAALYHKYSMYVRLNHTFQGFIESREIKESMKQAFRVVQNMEPGPERREKLLSTIKNFKAYNKMKFH